MNAGERNLAWADLLVAGLAAAGLRHAVLSPGARSSPLALAVLRRPELACHVINDERAAAYFALGIARATGQPAATLCTSGTAAANYLPAVMEANLAAVPLLLITADRPAGLHDWGANQAADQSRLYGSQVRACHALPLSEAAPDPRHLHMLGARLMEECRQPLGGPVHINVPFAEPLLPGAIPAPPALPPGPLCSDGQPPLPAPAALDALAARITGRPGVILCGETREAPGFAAAVAALADKLDAPILADPLSGLRHGPHDRSRILAHQAGFLPKADLPPPAWVLRFGSFPVSRALERWLSECVEAHHALIAPLGRWPDPLWRSDAVLRGDAAALASELAGRVTPAPRAWCAAWQRAEREAADGAAALRRSRPLFEGSVAHALLSALPAHSSCFVGNSLAIRAADSFGDSSDTPLRLHGNRGASGIDGNIATAAGIAAATTAPVALLIGDQTALHDCSSLALLAGRDAVVVVMDNGGGRIFRHLPLADVMPPELLARGWTAAPRVDFGALATAFGLRHAQAGTVDELRGALETAFGCGGAWLVRATIG